MDVEITLPKYTLTQVREITDAMETLVTLNGVNKLELSSEVIRRGHARNEYIGSVMRDGNGEVVFEPTVKTRQLDWMEAH